MAIFNSYVKLPGGTHKNAHHGAGICTIIYRHKTGWFWTRATVGCAKVNIKVGSTGLSSPYGLRATCPFHHHMDDILKSVYMSILDSKDPALICPKSLLPKLTYDNPYSNIFKPLSIAPCWPSTKHNFRVCCTPMKVDTGMTSPMFGFQTSHKHPKSFAFPKQQHVYADSYMLILDLQSP